MSNQKIIDARDVAASVITLDELGFEPMQIPVCELGFSTYIRALRQNWRQGTLGCKTRSEVNRTNKKPWKQKGTGRARAGSARSPLWRGGGLIFGPQPRVRELEVTKKVKKRVLGDMMREFAHNNRIVCLDWQMTGNDPKTSKAYKALMMAQLQNKKINVFVSMDDFVTQASFANIPTVKLMLFDQANAFDLANAEYWVFFKKDFGVFKEMVSKWI